MTCWCEGKCPHIERPKKLAEAHRHGAAHMALREALSKAPFCVESNIAMATVLMRGNHAEQAGVHLERAARYGDPARIALARAEMLRAQGRLDESVEQFDAALMLAPDSAQVTAGYIGAVEMSGNVKQAKVLADAARARFPDDIHIRRQAGIVAYSMGDYAGVLATLTGDNLEPIELLDRGRAKEKLGDHAGAWGDWMTAKAALRDKSGHRYDVARFRNLFQALAEAALPPKPDYYRGAASIEVGQVPLFVTGFPRSGTTLLETVLSSHSKIVAGDELMGLVDVIDAMPRFLRVRTPYPAALLATALGENAVMPGMLRDLYMRLSLERIALGGSKVRHGTKFFTDKMPLNEMHLPLIRLLFPNAHVFYLRRHPLDVMVSCMSQWLVFGGFYASSLESCAQHYFSIDALVQHYRKFLALVDTSRPNFCEVRYENFIADPAGMTSAILDCAGLSFEPRCIEPEKNKRVSRTLSYRQVREPINDRSIGRWRHFRDQLKPAIEILRPILEREGYEH